MRLRILALLLCFCALAATACKKDEPTSTRWDDAAAAVATPAPSASSAVPKLPTGSFNRFFPKDGVGGYDRNFTADKPGYSEAKLRKDGKDVATLTISDAAQVPDAKTKFAEATEKIGGYPAVKMGNNQSGVLVKDRFQVKVSSQTLDHEARKKLLEAFDLGGLGS